MSDIRKFMRDKNVSEKSPKIFLHNRWKIIGILIVIAVIIVVAVKIYFDNKEFDSYKVIDTIDINNVEGETQYLPFGSALLRYSNDGVSYIEGSTEVWNQAFELNNPLIDICGEYAVIGEKNSNKIYLFDTKGLVNEMSTSNPITDLEVSSQGVIASVTQDGEMNYFKLVDKEGIELANGQSYLEGNKYGYLIDSSLSDDGNKVVNSYMCIDEGTVKARIVFYNYSGVGQNEEDRVVGGFNIDNTTVVPKVEFLSNNIACAFGDNMFSLYSIKEKPELIYQSDLFENEIKSIFYNKDYIGLVFYNDDTNLPYVMHIYDVSGDEILTKEFDFNYTDIKFADNNILLYNSASCEVYNLSGVKKFEHTFDKVIVSMSGEAASNRFIIANSNEAEVIKLKYKILKGL